MSRLRARTWTPVERECMEWYRLWRGTKDGLDYARKSHWPMRCIACNTKVDSMSPSEIVDLAERIMRTKGIDLRRARLRAIGDVETHIDPVTGIGYEELANIGFVLDFKRMMDRNDRYCYRRDARRRSCYANRKYPLKPSPAWTRVSLYDIGWVPSDSNPNIYVRREG